LKDPAGYRVVNDAEDIRREEVKQAVLLSGGGNVTELLDHEVGRLINDKLREIRIESIEDRGNFNRTASFKAVLHRAAALAVLRKEDELDAL
jgi:hypothetical protein